MLSGNLDLFALADVLRFVARSGATGIVNIYRAADAGRLLLSDGAVVGATVDGFDAADADGVVDAGLRLIDGAGGEFALDIEQAAGPARFEVEEFLTIVGRRRAEWRKILSAIGSLDEPLRISAQLPDGAAEITLSALEWQIAVLADGHLSLRDIARRAGESAFAVATALLAMSNAGLLVLGDGTVPAHTSTALPEEAEEAAVLEYGSSSGDDVREPDDVLGSEPTAVPEVDAGDDEDLDPAELLRELGEQRPPAPRGRRTGGVREEQHLRLRAR